MTDFYIDKLAVVGVGLIGGSLALALKEAGAVGHVVGIGRGLPNLETALRLGVVDSFTRDLAEGVADADVVFLATPVLSLGSVAAQAMPHLKPGAILTDGGSVKQAVIDAIEPHLRDDVHFVPGHPIAGTENSGAEAAFATLYRDRRCILTPTARTAPAALERIRRMWQVAGSKVVVMEVDKHDRVLAAISHLPHVIASLMAAVTPEQYLPLAATGWLDTTRVASGEVELWRQILFQNRPRVLHCLDEFAKVLSSISSAIENQDQETIIRILSAGKQRRDALAD